MSLASIRAALETQLAAITPALATAFENVSFNATVGTPYQRVTLLPAQPVNVEIGPGYTEQGLFAVDLFYPKETGPAAAVARAALIRAAFPFASSLTAGGFTVHIIGTPEIGPARPDEDRFMVPVRIRWQARIGS